MSSGMLITIVVVVVVVLAVVYLWSTYNSLVSLRVRVDEAWSDITVQMKRRADLIPGLVDTVKGYATHEAKIFAEVTRARAETISADSPRAASEADGHLQQALKSMFSVAEAYPQLQAGQNFLKLQSELADTENKIQASRRFYNGGTREYNTKIKVFPNNLVAKGLGFTEREFFEVDNSAAVSEPPRIQF